MSELLTTVFNEAGYTLSIVAEEPVALAGSIPAKAGLSTPLFNGTLIAMALIMAAVVVTMYFIQCRQLQIRINSLMSGASTVRKGRYSVWSYKSLKAECARLEYIISDKMINETVRI